MFPVMTIHPIAYSFHVKNSEIGDAKSYLRMDNDVLLNFCILVMVVPNAFFVAWCSYFSGITEAIKCQVNTDANKNIRRKLLVFSCSILAQNFVAGKDS